jgi:GNAT superfamily N-acetyltransferase
VTINFRIVDPSELDSAHDWHMAFAQAHEAIYPRDRKTFEQLIADRCVWCAVDSHGEYQAMAYAAFSEEDNIWEIGGLMVSSAMRGKGLGRIMMRLPLAHLLFNENPFKSETPPTIVAHVLASNNAPRSIISEMLFEKHHSVEIPAQHLPGLKADPDGFIRGDEFHLKIPDALLNLADWCDSWDERLLDRSQATIDLLSGVTRHAWASAFRDMAKTAIP